MNQKKNIAVAAMLLVFVATMSCGGSSNAGPDFSWGPEYETEWHNLFNSKNYSGYIAVMFKADTEMRMNNKALTSSLQPSYAKNVNDIVTRYDAEIQRGSDISEEAADRALARAEREGKRFHNWNLYYRVKIENPAKAEAFYVDLVNTGSVEFAYPISKFTVFGSPGPTPDVSASQNYLGSHSLTGGFNVQSAWNEGVYGQDVVILDIEKNWNVTHEDLPTIDDASFFSDYDPIQDIEQGVVTAKDHGTAVVGMLAGVNNGYGVTGMAHLSTIKLNQAVTDHSPTGVGISLVNSFDGEDQDVMIRHGDVILIEGYSGGDPDNNECGVIGVDGASPTDIPCLPAEAAPMNFESIRQMTDRGIIIVQPVGNSAIDVGLFENRIAGCQVDPIPVYCPDLERTEDEDVDGNGVLDNYEMVSGSLIVGASVGGTNDSKSESSNCGKRIDFFGWGGQVTTTGYGYDIVPPDVIVPNAISDPDDENRWYTNSFRGTSSAAAMVAGAVALVQSYAKDYYRKNVVSHKKVYFNAWQMKDLLKATASVPAPDPAEPGCHVGAKLDIGAAMIAIQNGEFVPNLVPDTDSLFRKPLAVEGIRYDIDKDGRADLISYDEGVWKVDLSTVAPNVASPHPDNYGAWDLEINLGAPLYADSIIFPVVHDYDSDGDADLALYNSKYGYWYIKYTTDAILNSSVGESFSWDVIVDYSSDPAWMPYSRPMSGDYNGDNWLDLAVVTPDGHWVTDFGGIGRLEKIGGTVVYKSDFEGFEKDVKFLTDAQLAAAPGWAYLPIAVEYNGDAKNIVYKVPDGIPNGNQIKAIRYSDFMQDGILYNDDWIVEKTKSFTTLTYDANDSYFIGTASSYSGYTIDITVFSSNGEWNVVEGGYGPYAANWNMYSFFEGPVWPEENTLCQPVIADYDGDGLDDIATKCPDQWKIAYYSNTGSGMPSTLTLVDERNIDLQDNIASLPPTIYPGGMSYQNIKEILEYYELWDEYQDKDPFTPITVRCTKYIAPAPNCVAK